VRAIVYPYKIRSARAAAAVDADAEPGTDVGPTYYAGRGASRHTAAVSAADEDDYLARLAKHVPGEVLAAFLLIAALLGKQPWGWRVAGIFAGFMLAVALDRRARGKQDRALRPPALVADLFVIAAFAAWAVGTTSMARDLVSLNEQQAGFIVVVVALGLAVIDDWASAHWEKLTAARSKT